MDDFSQGVEALEQQDYDSARRAFERHLGQQAQDADAWQNLGIAHFYLQDIKSAQTCWQQAKVFTREPETLEETIFDAAHTLVHTFHQGDSAIGLYQMLLDSVVFGRRAYYFLIACLMGQHQMTEALQLMEQALRKFPNDVAFRIQNTFLLPGIYTSAEDFLLWRERFIKALDDLEHWIESKPLIESGQVLTYSPIFNLMPMGMNEKSTFERVSRLWRSLFVEANAKDPVSPPPGPRLRLALVSASVWNHSTMHYFLGMLEMLSQETQIETAIFDFAVRTDAMTEYVKSLVDHYVRIERYLDRGLDAIRAWQPEILMYLDIGQETLLYTLAHYRLAPVQCVTAGVPITTGIDTMDYYFSSRCFEVPDAQQHYSETLICLEQLMVCMRPPHMPAELKDRQAFGIPASAHVYFFPHTLFRVDPELDEVLATILIRDPQAEIYFMQLLNTGFHLHLQNRFVSRYAHLADRLHFLPWTSQPEFLNLLSLADVALDAHRLAGGNVSFQSFWVGTPMVTYPSSFLRGRIASGLYRLLGLEDWIATDWQDYLEKALRLGTDPGLRAQLSQAMLAGRDKIFNRPEGMQEIFGYFKNWAAALRT